MIKSGETVYIYVEELETKDGNKYTIARIKDGKDIRRLHFARELPIPKESGKYKLDIVRPYTKELPCGLYVEKYTKA